MVTITIPPMKIAQAFNDQVVNGLVGALANTYTLASLHQSAHWNGTGCNFFALHPAFGTQYESLFDLTDTIAERIRALQSFVVVDLAEFKAMAKLPSLVAPFTVKECLDTLITAHEKNINDLNELIKICGATNDLVTQNMVMGWVESEQKTLWMLKSSLPE